MIYLQRTQLLNLKTADSVETNKIFYLEFRMTSDSETSINLSKDTVFIIQRVSPNES